MVGVVSGGDGDGGDIGGGGVVLSHSTRLTMY